MITRQKIMAVGLGLVLLAAFWMPASVKGQGIISGNSIQSGQVIDKNLLLNGTDVTIDGTVNGDVLAFGRTITVNGQVNGTLVAVGQTIKINGQVSGNLLAGAVGMEMGSKAKVGRDLYFAGARLSLPDGAIVQRDLFLLSLEAQLSGKVERDIHAIIGPLQIVGFFFPALKSRIPILSNIQPETTGLIETPRLVGLGAGTLGSTYWMTAGQQATQQAAQIGMKQLQTWGFALLRNLVALLVLGLLGIWLAPAPFNSASKKIQQSPWRIALSGLIFFLGGWFVAVLGLILMLILAIFFYWLSFPNLGFLLGALGLLGVGLGLAVFWLAIAYLSKLVFALLLGRLLLKWFRSRFSQSNLWPLLLGIVLYALVASIPYLGFVVATVVTFMGLGAIWGVSFPLVKLRKGADSIPAEVSKD
jgi:cytoskeletal protein CcmA (bactofilin family)